jgi:hypothetical protein
VGAVEARNMHSRPRAGVLERVRDVMAVPVPDLHDRTIFLIHPRTRASNFARPCIDQRARDCV